ncbi:DUF2510 domain-containing protein, partial [Pimelobacter simplex]|uniref:DUF2510 domain-containing protein n=1 Tax=Nocardioides simplex TaxID=2045 RepID=UPI0027DC246B
MTRPACARSTCPSWPSWSPRASWRRPTRRLGPVTNAGWYPDPAGAPDTYRYWDGQAWSQMTTTQPSGGARPAETPATPPPAAPTQYGAVPT